MMLMFHHDFGDKVGVFPRFFCATNLETSCHNDVIVVGS